MTSRIIFALLCAAATLLGAPNLMPWPAGITVGNGVLKIEPSFRVEFSGYQEPRLKDAGARLLDHLHSKTGLTFAAASSAPAALLVHCERASEPVQKFGEDESYRLMVTSRSARLDAPNPLGILRGMETFLQIVERGSNGWSAPEARIDDRPRFGWRGLHMDVSRHWMPVEVILRNLDGMAAVKLNVFHWHLSDDQGFRVESKRWPKLQEDGSDGHFYTQAQVREVIAYARERGIRVVPEFDIPGHFTSWVVGYPRLASAPGKYAIERRWGVFDPTLDPTNEATYRFLESFIAEMAALFPDDYFHIGGDEVNGKQWRSPRIRAFVRRHHLKDNHGLQAYFNKRVQAILQKHHKRMEGWDEIQSPDLPKDIVIQSWQGQKSLADAARLGYSGILSSGYYLDHMEPASKLYLVDPLENETAGLTAEEKSRVLGGEICMWAEYVTPENVDSRIWPRTAAVAERLWSPQGVKDVDSMYARLEVVSHSLDWFGLTHNSGYRKMLDRLSGGQAVEPLTVLVDVLTPANLNQRNRLHKYTQLTPLNRLVDAARPDSATPREFAKLVDRMDRDGIRRWLTLWRDNDARLRPAIQASPILAPDAAVSSDLSRLGSVGLQALDYLEKKQQPPADWLAAQRSFVASAGKVNHEVLIAVAPSVGRLLDAAEKQ